MKYRVKKETRADGDIYYFPQYKYSFLPLLWFSFTQNHIGGTTSIISFMTKKEALKYISSGMDIKRHYKISKVEYLNIKL